MNFDQIANLLNLLASTILGLGLLAIEVFSKRLSALDMTGVSIQKITRRKSLLSFLENAKIILLLMVFITYLISFIYLTKSVSEKKE